MAARILWVVEILHGGWCPTVGAALSRHEGRRELAQWCEDNPTNTFRLVKYEPVNDAPKVTVREGK